MKIAIVTGASSGMGREFVLQLGKYVQVDEIWVIARRTAALESLKEELSTPFAPSRWIFAKAAASMPSPPCWLRKSRM